MGDVKYQQSRLYNEKANSFEIQKKPQNFYKQKRYKFFALH